MSDPDHCLSLDLLKNSLDASVPFDFDAIDHALDPGTDEAPAAAESPRRFDLAEALRALLVDHIVRRTHPRGPMRVSGPSTLASTLALAELVAPSGKSLAQIGREAGVSVQLLSRAGLRLSKELKLFARWQRHASRATYARRQREVAAGCHTNTCKHEMRRLREAKRARKAA